MILSENVNIKEVISENETVYKSYLKEWKKNNQVYYNIYRVNK